MQQYGFYRRDRWQEETYRRCFRIKFEFQTFFLDFAVEINFTEWIERF
jgi:hypothetical protein